MPISAVRRETGYCQHAGNADRGEKERRARESAKDHGVETLRGGGRAYDLVERPDIGDRQQRVDRADFRSNRRDQCRRRY